MNNLFYQYNGTPIIKSDYIPKKKKRIPVRWRTWKERFFSLPFKPKELFIYEEIEEEQILFFNNMAFMNSVVYNQVQHHFKVNSISS